MRGGGEREKGLLGDIIDGLSDCSFRLTLGGFVACFGKTDGLVMVWIRCGGGSIRRYGEERGWINWTVLCLVGLVGEPDLFCSG